MPRIHCLQVTHHKIHRTGHLKGRIKMGSIVTLWCAFLYWSLPFLISPRLQCAESLKVPPMLPSIKKHTGRCKL
ncbi:hypothetical protein XELAEV_18016305mg [Xenopus laevis]|uniref:Uncharacterized protein n=1 Tax=Xenopus laevis TaxID=8355 RepID=A0A974DL81_XENLA|nr:hypothetical protein XELAEV_18016305mg [Xenopus laevis]